MLISKLTSFAPSSGGTTVAGHGHMYGTTMAEPTAFGLQLGTSHRPGTHARASGKPGGILGIQRKDR